MASVFGFALFYLLSLVGKKIFNKPVIGGGDSKLSALIGSWIGIQGLFISIWLAFISAGIFVVLGLSFKKIKRNQKIPFGVFLSPSILLNFRRNFTKCVRWGPPMEKVHIFPRI